MAFHLRKVITKARSGNFFKASSATWEVEEIQDIWLYKAPEDTSEDSVWKIIPAKSSRNKHSSAIQDLFKQRFPTRREALQALEVVMMMLEDQENRAVTA